MLHLLVIALSGTRWSQGVCISQCTSTQVCVAGVYAVWCLEHGQCLGFCAMRDKESPRTTFEVFFTRWLKCPEGVLDPCNLWLMQRAMPTCDAGRNLLNLPSVDTLGSCGAVFVYDNGCNHAHYFLNREPKFFKDMHQLIDAMHFRTHTSCPTSFDIKTVASAHSGLLSNSQLAEQRNSKLSRIETQVNGQYVKHACLDGFECHCGLST